MERLLDMNAVRERVPLSTVEIYRRIKRGEFPKQISIGPARVAWVASEVEQWINETIEKSRNPII